MTHFNKTLAILALLAPLTTGCNDHTDDPGAETEPSGPCAGAAALSGVAMLEIKESPNNAKDGIKLVKQVKAELAAECKAKGYDQSAAAALACYQKNKGKPGYRVWKGCDQAAGKAIVAAVVAKHNGG